MAQERVGDKFWPKIQQWFLRVSSPDVWDPESSLPWGCSGLVGMFISTPHLHPPEARSTLPCQMWQPTARLQGAHKCLRRRASILKGLWVICPQAQSEESRVPSFNQHPTSMEISTLPRRECRWIILQGQGGSKQRMNAHIRPMGTEASALCLTCPMTPLGRNSLSLHGTPSVSCPLAKPLDPSSEKCFKVSKIRFSL